MGVHDRGYTLCVVKIDLPSEDQTKRWLGRSCNHCFSSRCFSLTQILPANLSLNIIAQKVMSIVHTDKLLFTKAVDIAFSITISVAVSKGTGRHSDTLPSHEAAIQVGYWNTIATELAIFSFGLPKVAIALLLGRILNVRPALCWLLYSLAGVLVVFAVIEDIVFIEQCSPINAMWDKSVPATCWDPSPIAVSGVIYGGMYFLLLLFCCCFCLSFPPGRRWMIVVKATVYALLF